MFSFIFSFSVSGWNWIYWYDGFIEIKENFFLYLAHFPNIFRIVISTGIEKEFEWRKLLDYPFLFDSVFMSNIKSV